MTENSSVHNYEELVQRAIEGDEAVLAQLFERNRKRLRKVVDLRMDRRIRGRVNPSDVLQEAFIDLANQLPNYAKDPKLPFFVWMRRLTGQRLAKVHRYHLGASKRDAAREVSLYRGRMPQATSMAIASKLIGNSTSIGGKFVRAERQIKLQDILNGMEEDNREVLAMRHFEQLTNTEIAFVLEISESAAGMRHLRALRRLQSELKQFPDLFGEDFSLYNAAQSDKQRGKD